ncbi:hypothetical protein [Puia dinghuensis]|uniref:NurA domain-containing protein n=1 Tax=Puia dinghuensis TaxID=1792502 RepID=A0A8J2UHU6_9BACT|nr:hypothetical protein [Puia dinghuensis]GGB19635.1 hypothetical protein GCM10011511_49220 [Puia dinghuensis]
MADFAPGGKFERESRTSHIHIINDEEVAAYLSHCTIPVDAQKVEFHDSFKYDIAYPDANTIDYFIAVDGEATTLPVNEGFPSSLVTFFQFGTLVIVSEDLDNVEKKPFVAAADIKKLKEIKRDKFVMPTKNVALKNDGVDFKTVVRTSIQDFFRKEHSGNTPLLETVFWLIFEKYRTDTVKQEYVLAHCPHCGTVDIVLEKDKMRLDYSWECTEPKCRKNIFLTDVFLLFVRMDNETGAEAIVGYLKNVIETFLLLHTMKSLLEIEDGLVNQFLLVKDGPLSFSGETSRIYRPVQKMISYLRAKNNINLVGVESSGPFVDHARQIRDKLKPGQAFLLNNKHIYTYILVGDPRTQQYGERTYYGGKLIYKSLDGRVYVLSMPVDNHVAYYNRPELADFANVQEVLFCIAKLRCDIYENALIPIAVINKLISLSTQSGTKILEKFAKKTVKK